MACPICFGGEDPVVRDSLTAGISVLLGVTLIVLGCFARFFLVLARRARAAAAAERAKGAEAERAERAETARRGGAGSAEVSFS